MISDMVTCLSAEMTVPGTVKTLWHSVNLNPIDLWATFSRSQCSWTHRYRNSL